MGTTEPALFVLRLLESQEREKMKNHDDSIHDMAPAAAVTCTVAFGLSQLIMRYFAGRLDSDIHIVLMIVSVQAICFLLFRRATRHAAVTARAVFLSALLLLDLVVPCPMAWFIQLVVMFHAGEFLATALFSSATLRHSSFLLNHSREYHVAMVIACVEYAVEYYFFKWHHDGIMHMGITLTVSGDLLRKLSMFWCGSGFTHLIQYRRRTEHRLVTTGPYAVVRHPGYTGWAIWAIASQVVLCNPISFVLYTLATYKFFEDRIPDEESLLFHFFGDEYAAYKKAVPHSGIPFVTGQEENPW